MLKKFFVEYLGINSTLLYTLISRVIQGFGGLFSIFLVLRYLSKDEQGYYYTFISLLSVQIFFELGLSNIIVQYVAHEYALISDDNHKIDRTKSSKLTSLLRFFARWYIILGLILIFGLGFFGILFFNHFNNNSNIDWAMPWIILSISTGLLFIITFFLAFIEGLGRIEMVAKIRFTQQVVNIIATSFLLIYGGKLYTSGISALLVVLVLTFFIVMKPIRSILIEIWNLPNVQEFDYKKEILPYQWRIAISWIGGYLIFQMFNPILFAYSGAKAAGQMGASLAVLNGILSLSLSWVSTKVAYWSRLIALKQNDVLNQSFNATLWQSSAVNIAALLLFCTTVALIGNYYPSIQTRFISPMLLALFASTFLINNIINCWATYLRCFKQEPFLIQAIIVGILSGASTYFLGRYYSLDGLVWGYFVITVSISLPISYYLFISYRAKFLKSFMSDVSVPEQNND